MAVNTPETSQLRLFDFRSKKKLFLILCAAILWVGALIAYFTPGFDYWLVASFNSLRANYLFADFWYYYTKYMLYVVGFPLLIIYIASFKIDKLKPYRLVLLLTIMTSAIGNPIIDPILKDLIARPRPQVAHLDLNSLYYESGFSFPSGHAFQAFSNTLPLIICFFTNDATFKRNWKKIVLALILLVYAIILAFSRIFAGVHYFSDVLFGIGFAIILMVILASLMQWLLNKDYLNLQNEKLYALVFLIMTAINYISFW
ncbi:phosphatase PAP2 family protein [Methanobacterium sp.]|uniref:phosphatase PAP2 family protein n=1 Tax=Methanobacterium sp. TaxID=2164 RepID=UPI0025E52826|nr:phosphatase PAP2 family protein [Methanobacterium sp.]MBI5459410.1 phosphatase PAP2 family protein [Methanobacterium sp.]